MNKLLVYLCVLLEARNLNFYIHSRKSNGNSGSFYFGSQWTLKQFLFLCSFPIPNFYFSPDKWQRVQLIYIC